MKPRITILTLGVDDLSRSLNFYRDGLGLTTQSIVGENFEYGAVAFFDLQAGLQLAIWPRKSIARDAGVPACAPCPTEFTIGHNVSSREAVNEVMEQAENAGAVIVKAAQATVFRAFVDPAVTTRIESRAGPRAGQTHAKVNPDRALAAI